MKTCFLTMLTLDDKNIQTLETFCLILHSKHLFKSWKRYRNYDSVFQTFLYHFLVSMYKDNKVAPSKEQFQTLRRKYPIYYFFDRFQDSTNFASVKHFNSHFYNYSLKITSEQHLYNAKYYENKKVKTCFLTMLTLDDKNIQTLETFCLILHSKHLFKSWKRYRNYDSVFQTFLYHFLVSMYKDNKVAPSKEQFQTLRRKYPIYYFFDRFQDSTNFASVKHFNSHFYSQKDTIRI